MVLDLLAEHINKPHQQQSKSHLLSFKEKAQLMAVFWLGYVKEVWDNLHKKIFGKKDKPTDDIS